MKTFVPLLILFILTISANAQIISRFTWENNPVTKAAYGPDAISVSSYATVSENGARGSKGLNPGAGRYDIDLVLEGTPFNKPALDISVDFRREESQASFFYRGTYFNFGMNGGSLGVNFMLINGSVITTVNSGGIYTVANDHRFHNYRFNYDNNTGVARMWVDSVVVYTYNGTAGVPLYFTGAGNVTIGKDMDGTGNNVAILDNLVVQYYANALLPLNLLSFSADKKNDYAVLNWSTTQEVNVTSFVVERSSNGASFSALSSIAASNGYSTINNYLFTDSTPSAVSYYRLKMMNDNGTFTYSAIKTVSFANNIKSEISVFPNPTVDYLNIKLNNARTGKYHYTVLSVSGQVVTAADVNVNSSVAQIKVDLTKTTIKGVIIIRLDNTQANTTETFTVIKK